MIPGAPVALALACLGFVAIGLPDGALGIAWPSLRAEFGWPQSGLALILTALALGFLLASNLATGLSARLGVGTLLAASTAVVALAGLLFAWSPTGLVVPLAAFTLGLGSATIDTGLNAHGAHHFSARHLNWLHAAYGIGAALGPALMTWALTQGSWRLGYALLAAALAALALLFAVTRGRWARTPPVRARPGRQPDGRFGAAALLQVVAFFLYTGLETAAGQWSFAVLSEGRGLSLTVAGAATAVFWTSLFLGRIAVGFVADALGADRLVRTGALTALGGAVLFALLPGATAMVGLAVLGLGLAPIFPMLMKRTAERFAVATAARLFGLQVSAAMLGALAVPSLGGLIADLVSLEAIALLLGATALSLALALVVLSGRPIGRRAT